MVFIIYLKCMKYIETNLPILYFNKTKHQHEYADLLKEMISQNHIENLPQSENVKLQLELFSFHLDIEKEKKSR